MSGESRKSVKWFVRLAVVAGLVPVLTATTCPTTPAPPTPPAGNTTLFSGNLATSTDATFVTQSPCTPIYAPPARGFLQTFNAVANKLVTVQVSGPTANSRPQIQAVDISLNQVANTGSTPSVSNPSVTFTPTTSNLYGVEVLECADITAGSVYAVSITQAP